MPEIIDLLSPLSNKLQARELNFICNIYNVNINQNEYGLLLLDKYQKDPTRITNRVSFKHNIISMLDAEHPLIAIAKIECINKSYFDWIDTNNNRLCNYIWSYIRIFKSSLLTDGITCLTDINKDDVTNIKADVNNFTFSNYLYESFMIELLPKNNKTKKDCIISFFDLLDAIPEIKIKIISEMKKKWIHCSEKKDVVKWVDKSNQSWAWHYIYDDNDPVWYFDNGQSTDLQDGIVTTFDLLYEIPDSRQLLLKNMKSAWSQKAYRDKNNGKKAVSVVLPEDIIKMLDGICVKTDRRKNEVITRLIREEYDKQKNSGR